MNRLITFCQAVDAHIFRKRRDARFDTLMLCYLAEPSLRSLT